MLAGAATFALAGVARAAGPGRIVSLNPCLDAILIELVEPGHIAALSHYAREASSSTIADRAARLPFTYGAAEEIVALAPDIVLASHHNSIATRNALERLGVRVELFGVPNSVEESLAQIARVADAVSEGGRGAALADAIALALRAAAPPPGEKPIEALVFQARGLVAGEGTLLDDMLRRTGFVNVAARYGVRQWGNVPLERIVADPPQILLAAEASPGAPTWAERVLSHPALAAIAHKMKRGPFPEAQLYCGGPVLLKTAATLASARRRYMSGEL